MDQIAKLERMLEAYRQENTRLAGENSILRATRFKEFNNEECWIWQGDGEDHLESLVCPVVIRASDLQSIIDKEAKSLKNFIKEFQHLRDHFKLKSTNYVFSSEERARYSAASEAYRYVIIRSEMLLNKIEA